LAEGEMKIHGLLPWASNYAFLVTVRDAKYRALAIYKPCRGERLLWDFPRGTLCRREYAAYLACIALGWSFVPPTVLREGPHGLGVVQLFIDADPDAHYFTLRDQHVGEFQRLAVFDYVVNNTDRKAGHCLLGTDGHIWAIDHGVTFHAESKLRTVIWDFVGQPIPDNILTDLRAFRARLGQPDELIDALSRLLSDEEMMALRERVDTLLDAQVFPGPSDAWPAVPWPPL
jgi:hypothetical protein